MQPPSVQTLVGEQVNVPQQSAEPSQGAPLLPQGTMTLGSTGGTSVCMSQASGIQSKGINSIQGLRRRIAIV